MLLDNLALFLLIVEKGGLSAAGREIGLSPASVSERLAALEAHYGAALLKRTTRAISLTEEGRLLVDGARRLLAEADELESGIRSGTRTISGPIRLSAPEDMGRRYIVPILDRFLAEHADVTVDLNLTDGYLDLVGQGMDFAIRHGVLADSTLRSRSLGENRRVVCAAPSYIEAMGR
ncbi:LysR family transcriptional regulator, partial [Ensifer adhaerens]